MVEEKIKNRINKLYSSLTILEKEFKNSTHVITKEYYAIQIENIKEEIYFLKDLLKTIEE